MSNVWDAEVINRFLEQGEDTFVTEYPCLISRVALNVVADTADYSLPDLLHSIRRVTWKGKKLWPLPKRFQNEMFQGVQFTQKGEPDYYLYNGITSRTIRLFPTPNVSLASTTSNLFGSEIGNRCIIEYFQLSDHSSKVMPTFFRRRLLKSYILSKCFQVEGRGQNLKNAKYHEKKWEELSVVYGNLMSELYNRGRRLVVTQPFVRSGTPGAPHYNYSKFGISVGEGE